MFNLAKAPQYQAEEAIAVGRSEPTTGFSTRFASLSLHKRDRIRLLDFPQEIIFIIRSSITQSWPRGVQEERSYGGSHELKLHGNPWSGQYDEAIHSRRLVKSILASLFDKGWVLALSTDVSRKTFDLDTMIFRHQDPAPLPREWMCLAFSRSDRIRLLDAPKPLIDAVTATIRHVSRPDASQPHDNARGIHEIKLTSNLWYASSTDTVLARKVLLQLITVLEKYGYTVYASIDQKRGSDNHSETDTWYCCRPMGWEQGAPVYHA